MLEVLNSHAVDGTEEDHEQLTVLAKSFSRLPVLQKRPPYGRSFKVIHLVDRCLKFKHDTGAVMVPYHEM